ncbi:sensor histidine kinase [Paenibacillus humicola]|uniref:sensor histidine kinase n=1 Tax=Paenibacillus humicola TaxID=3110540 RepID=UPI00237ACF6C|nr:sensor histidine kinase [Paenibacillus humicola]
MFNPRKASFKVKLLLGISAIILFTFSMAGVFSYRTHLRLFEDEVSGRYVKAGEQAMAQLDLRIRELSRIANYVVFNPTIEKNVTKLSKGGVPPVDRYSMQSEIGAELGQVKFDAPQVLSLYLFDLSGRNYYYGLMRESVEPIVGETFKEILAKVQASEGEMVWMNKRLPSHIEKSGYRDVVIAAQWMRSKFIIESNSEQLDEGYMEDGGGMYGMMVMVVDQYFLARSFREIAGGDHAGSVYLFDRHHNLLYTNDMRTGPAEAAKLLERKTDGIEKAGGASYYFAKHVSPETQFTLVSRISMADFLEKSRLILKISVASGGISVLLSAMLIFLLSHRLLRPLRELVPAMRTMREGKFDIRIKPRSSDELGYIADSFNAMAANLSSLIKEVYLRQISEKEAELKALQAQLNPHFLYNTLNGLYWKLYLQDDRETASLVSALSGLLKYSLERVRKRTTLREEIEQIRNFLRIQDAFVSSRFHARIEMDEDVAACPTLRLFLQPIVENVFVHAFREQRDTPNELLIRAYRLHSFLKLEVSDNGCGMSPAEIARVMSDELADEGRTPLGVRSVMRRIDLMYGPPYRLEIASAPGEGTTVHLFLPLVQGAEERETDV